MKVRKAIIPAAGMGSRMLPATISIPKEMLTVVDKPVIQYVVEEAVSAGITDILIIISTGKEAIQQHFDVDPDRVTALRENGKEDLADELVRISQLANITYVYQAPLKGLGDAIKYGQDWVGDESFVVLLGDSIMDSSTSISVLQQVMNTYEQYQQSTIAISEVEKEIVYKYGVLDGQQIGDSMSYEVNDWIEKPSVESAPSNLVISGIYVLTPAIFDCLDQTKPGYGGEIQLTDAMRILLKKEKTYAVQFDGIRYDVGNKLDFIKTNVILGMKNKALGPALSAWIKTTKH